MSELNDRQAAFCHEYIIDFNGKRSAIKAGYSAKTAEVTASKLLRNAKVQAKIQELIDYRNKRTQVTADRVIAEFAKIAFSDVKDVSTWNEGGSFMRLKNQDEIDGSLISEIKNTENGIGVKMHDKMKALEALAKHTGVYDDRPQTTVNVGPYIEAINGAAKKVWDDESEE